MQSLGKIVEFSNTLDQVLISIKAKDKTKTSENLAKMYTILPEFTKNYDIDQLKKDIISTKTNIIKAYAYVDIEDWDNVQKEIINAEKKMVNMVNEMSTKENQKKFNINQTYILVEELKNSLPLKDKGIFYLKYKNILEELNVLI
ncbi:MAG: hypothetical protein HFJ51_01360 [Clostridia bacterium]|nr:hypothetical protein [Clostridia bacterium]